VRLYNPRPGDEADSSIQVEGATVELYADTDAAAPRASATVGPVQVSSTDAVFNFVRARVVKVKIGRVTGSFYGMRVASLAEIEVIARGEAGT
jgi:hypothetical protein